MKKPVNLLFKSIKNSKRESGTKSARKIFSIDIYDAAVYNNTNGGLYEKDF